MSKQSKVVDSNLATIETAAKALCSLVIGDAHKVLKETETETTWRKALVDLVAQCRTKEEASKALSAISKHEADLRAKNKWITASSSISKRYVMLKKPLKVICGHFKVDGKPGNPVSADVVLKVLRKQGWHKAYAMLNEQYPSGLGRNKAEPEGKEKAAADKGKAGSKSNTVETSKTEPSDTEKQVREHYAKVLRESPTECAILMKGASETALYNVVMTGLRQLTESKSAVICGNAEAALAAIEVAEKQRREEAKQASQPRVIPAPSLATDLRTSKSKSNATATQVTALAKAMEKAKQEAASKAA